MTGFRVAGQMDLALRSASAMRKGSEMYAACKLKMTSRVVNGIQ
jgi:hypothetical protein